MKWPKIAKKHGLVGSRSLTMLRMIWLGQVGLQQQFPQLGKGLACCATTAEFN